MRGVLLVAVLAVAPACGGTADPPIENSAQDGTRLHVRWWEIDGLRVVANEPNGPFFRDTLLGIDCRAVGWNDGTTSCAPVDLGGGYADVMYSDAGCTQPLAPIRTGTCQSPSFAIEFDAVGATLVVPVGAPSAVTQYYDLTNGDCIGPLQVAGSPFTFHESGAPVVRAALAELTVGPPRGSGRVQRQYLESEDGLRFPLGFIDVDLGRSCRLNTRTDEDTRCDVDASYRGTTSFLDPTCTTDPVFEEGSLEDDIYFRLIPGTPERQYYVPGEPVIPDPLYSGYDEASCQVREPSTVPLIRGLVIEMASLQRTPASGGRIVSMVLSGEGSRFADDVYDTVLDAECSTHPMADGTLRCLPRVSGVRAYYTDATCTTTVELHEHILNGGPPPRYLVRGDGDACTIGIAEIYALGPVRPGGVWDRVTPTLCHPHQAPGGEIVPAEYYTLGEPVSAATFADVTLMVGP